MSSINRPINRPTSGGRGGYTPPTIGPVTLPVSGSCPPYRLTLYSTGLIDTDDWKDLYKRYSSEYQIYRLLRLGSSNNVQIYINRYNDTSEQWKHKDSLSEQELNVKVQKYKLLKNRFVSYANCRLYGTIPVTSYINKIDYVIKIFELNSQ